MHKLSTCGLANTIGWIFLIVTFAVVGAGPLRAQQAEPSQTALTVVNAIAGPDNLFISFDDQSIWPPGFTSGQSTAAVLFPAGRKKAKFSCEGYASGEFELDLPPGGSCAIIVYPGEVVADGPDQGKRRLSVFSPKPHLAGAKRPTAIRWSAVLVGSRSPVEVEVNGKKQLLTPQKRIDLQGGPVGSEVKHRGKTILGATPEEAGDYIIVIYPVGEDLQAALLHHAVVRVEG
jgi:hypothetical protein